MGCEGASWGAGDILYLDLYGDCPGIYIYKTIDLIYIFKNYAQKNYYQ